MPFANVSTSGQKTEKSFDRIRMFGQSFFAGRSSELLEIIQKYPADRESIVIGALNVFLITECNKNEYLSDFYNRTCDFVTVDGMPLFYLSRYYADHPFPEMTGGPEMWKNIVKFGSHDGQSFYLWGATDALLKKAEERLALEFPGLKIAGRKNGYQEVKSQEFDETIECIQTLSPRFIFLGMPSPKKELVADILKTKNRNAVIVLIGGAFDYFAGNKNRPPRIVRKMCLEWFFRMIQEPKRLGPRYLRSNLAFARLLISGNGKR
jgi:N-acetylglucosaminyldiphosphoundecaprenol N-acetyl-beta-D-mannosaminyltransferase